MYTANQQQLASFDKKHDYLASKLNLGKEVLWMTKEQCIKCGPSIDEIIAICEKAMIAHGRKEYEMPAKIGIHPYDDVFYHAMPGYLPNQEGGGNWYEVDRVLPQESEKVWTSSDNGFNHS